MITFTSRSTSVTFIVDVHDAEPIGLRYSSSTTRFRPAKATVEFCDGEIARLVLAGPNVKKDGTDGQNGHDAYWFGSEVRRGAAPDWALKLIEDMTPAAQAAADRGPF